MIPVIFYRFPFMSVYYVADRVNTFKDFRRLLKTFCETKIGNTNMWPLIEGYHGDVVIGVSKGTRFIVETGGDCTSDVD